VTPGPRCGTPVELVRSVEAAHTFQLGEKYSAVMPGASFRGRGRGGGRVLDGLLLAWASPGCLSVLAEEHHDDRGLCVADRAGPLPGPPGRLGAGRGTGVAEAADALYGRLVAAGIDVLTTTGRVAGGQVRRCRPARGPGAPGPGSQGRGPGDRRVAVPGTGRGAGGRSLSARWRPCWGLSGARTPGRSPERGPGARTAWSGSPRGPARCLYFFTSAVRVGV